MATAFEDIELTLSTVSRGFDETKVALDDISRMLARIEAQLPYLATKADLAEKPSKTYMWGILAVLLTAYACGLAALAILK